MNLRKILSTLAQEIANEAESDPAFCHRLEVALGLDVKPKKTQASPRRADNQTPAAQKRPSNRRTAAVLDPVNLARQGEEVLRAALSRLNIEQLRDVIAEYGMDTGKL